MSVSVGEDVKAVHIPEQRPSMDTASIIGLIIWFICVLYSSIRSSSNAQAARYVNKTQCPSSLLKQMLDQRRCKNRNQSKWYSQSKSENNVFVTLDFLSCVEILTHLIKNYPRNQPLSSTIWMITTSCSWWVINTVASHRGAFSGLDNLRPTATVIPVFIMRRPVMKMGI